MRNFASAFAIACGLALLASQTVLSAPLDEFLTYNFYEDESASFYTEDAVHVIEPGDLLKRKEEVVIAGKTYDVEALLVERFSGYGIGFGGIHTLGFKARLIPVKNDASYESVDLSFAVRIEDPFALTASNPCSIVPCMGFDIELGISYPPMTASDREYFPDADAVAMVLVKSFGIKSIDYNWSTGEWRRLTLSTKTKHQPNNLMHLSGASVE